MDVWLFALIIVIIFVVIIAAIVIISRRGKFLCKIPNQDVFSYRQKTITKLKNEGYLVKEKKKGNVFVQKDNFSATTLVFKQNDADVDVSFIHSNSTLIFAVIIILILTVWIAGIIVAIIADTKSNEFRNNELKPLLQGYGANSIYCPNCGRAIPSDSRICPYCGKMLGE